MHITQVNTYALSYPLKEPFAYSRLWNRTRNACVKVPQGPGLGIEIDREVLARYTVGTPS